MAIGMKLTPVSADHDLKVSKLFGTPVVPHEWAEKGFGKDEIFVGQIRLADIAPFDPDDDLPHHGYLYFFVHADAGATTRPGQDMSAAVRYWDGEPDTVMEGFNSRSPIPNGLDTDFVITFEAAEKNAEGLKLLGVPSDWYYPQEAPKLLLQYDPLIVPVPFLSEMAGLAYFFFGRDTAQMTDVTFHPVYS